MQTRAILEGAAAVIKAGGDAHPEIMIPLVGHVNELKVVQTDLEKTAKAVEEEQGIKIDYSFGTMIEIPAPPSSPTNSPNTRRSSASAPTT